MTDTLDVDGSARADATDAMDAMDATLLDAKASDAANGAHDSSTLLDARQLDDDQGAPLEDAALPDPLVLGKSSSAGAALDLDDSMIYAQPLRMPWDATLELVGITSAMDASTGRAYVALYTDDGSAEGAPAAYINRGDEILLAPGPNTAMPFAHALEHRTLTAGTKYWLVAYIREHQGNPVRIHRDLESSAEGDYRSGSIAYGVPAASLTDTPTVAHTGEISIWIRVSR